MHAIQTVLHNFDSISLDEMDRVKLMNRVDTKFAFSFRELLDFLPQLVADYFVLEINGIRTPRYESLYFDDDALSFYNDHHNGRMNRFKVRIRNYVDSSLYFLEIKRKSKGRTDKKRISVTNFDSNFESEQINFLKMQLENKLGGKNQSTLKPNLWNSFHRITLVNKTETERLTLDFDLNFHWGENEKTFPQLVIAELKQEQINRNSSFFRLMKQNHVRPYRLSKYCIGAIEMYKHKSIKYNRFKEKLNKLKTINAHAE